jgi:hypothetical protein
MKRALVVVLFTAGGCSGFDLVAPAPESPPYLSVSVEVDRKDVSRYTVTAILLPGVDGAGKQKPVTDRSLQVNDSSLIPQLDLRQNFHYEWHGERSSADADSIFVRVPRAGPSPTIDYRVKVPIAGREDPFNISLVSGDDLRLHLTQILNPPGLSRVTETWQLMVRHAEEPGGANLGLLQVSGLDARPSEIRVPWEWIKAAARDSLVASLTTLSFYRGEGAPYRVEVFVNTVVTWHVRMLDSQTVPRLRGTVAGALLRDTLNAP